MIGASKTIHVRAQHQWVLDSKVAELGKVAKRYGFEAPTYGIVSRYTTTDDLNRQTEWLEVLIIEQPLVIEGNWTFVALIEHTEVGNIVRSAPGVTIDLTPFHEIEATCDHCGKTRSRTHTVVVVDERGVITRVGKQCLKMYMPKWRLPLTNAVSDYLWELEQLRGIDDEGIKAAAGRDFWETSQIMDVAIRSIATYGYGSLNNESITPTAEVVRGVLSDSSVFREDAIKFRKVDDSVVRLMFAAVNDMLTRLEAKRQSGTGLSTFDHNVLMACRVGGRKNLGIICWAVEAAKRALVEVIAAPADGQKVQPAPAEWYGSVGQKVTVTGICATRTSIETDYGYTNLIVIRTDDAMFKMFTTTATAPEAGERVTMTATIKSHDTWNDHKQTTVTRPKFQTI